MAKPISFIEDQRERTDADLLKTYACFCWNSTRVPPSCRMWLLIGGTAQPYCHLQISVIILTSLSVSICTSKVLLYQQNYSLCKDFSTDTMTSDWTKSWSNVDPLCPKGGTFYACASSAVQFVGCCTINPCDENSGICPQKDLRPASFSKEKFDLLVSQGCQGDDPEIQWFACVYPGSPQPPFMGCCARDACQTTGVCRRRPKACGCGGGRRGAAILAYTNAGELESMGSSGRADHYAWIRCSSRDFGWPGATCFAHPDLCNLENMVRF